MLYVDLSSFKSTVEVSNYRVWLYQSGIRPSATIGLGCVGSSLADPHYNKQANWNPDGSITLLGGSPRVIGEVTGGTETASEGGSSAEGNDTTSSPSDVSEGNSDDSGVNPLAIIAGVAALAGVGGAAYYFTRKRK